MKPISLGVPLGFVTFCWRLSLYVWNPLQKPGRQAVQPGWTRSRKPEAQTEGCPLSASSCKEAVGKPLEFRLERTVPKPHTDGDDDDDDDDDDEDDDGRGGQPVLRKALCCSP